MIDALAFLFALLFFGTLLWVIHLAGGLR